MNIKMRGGPELEQALRDLGGKVASRLGDNAVRAGARVVQKAAKAKAPVRTGALRDSLKVRAPRQKESGEAVAVVTTDLFYARFVEIGTRHQPPRSFMRAGADESQSAVLQKMTDNLLLGVEREIKKQTVPLEPTDD